MLKLLLVCEVCVIKNTREIVGSFLSNFGSFNYKKHWSSFCFLCVTSSCWHQFIVDALKPSSASQCHRSSAGSERGEPRSRPTSPTTPPAGAGEKVRPRVWRSSSEFSDALTLDLFPAGTRRNASSVRKRFLWEITADTRSSASRGKVQRLQLWDSLTSETFTLSLFIYVICWYENPFFFLLLTFRRKTCCQLWRKQRAEIQVSLKVFKKF